MKLSKIYAKVVWGGSGLDERVLETPRHDGSSLEVAREVYHRLLARLACVKAYEAQWWTIGAALIIGVCVGVGCKALGVDRQLTADLARMGNAGQALFLGTSLFVLAALSLVIPAGYARIHLRGGGLSEARKEASGVVRRVFLRENLGQATADLRDVWTHSWITSDGKPASSEISAGDATSTAAIPRAMWWIPSVYALGCGLMNFFDPINAWSVFVLIGLVKLVFDENPAKVRARELDTASAVEGAAFIEAGGAQWAQIGVKARQDQIAQAAKDPTLRIKLGDSRGIFAGRGDPHAPSAKLPFSLSLQDMYQSVLVLGGTGAGKTSGALRPIAHQVAACPGIGMLVLDGKGSLPAELGRSIAIRVIDPAHKNVSLVAGLTPVEIANTVREVMTRSQPNSGGGDRFWTDSAAILLRHAAVVTHAVGGAHWTLANIARVASQRDFEREAEQALNDEQVAKDPLLQEALRFFATEWANMDSEMRSSVIAVLQSWLSTLMGHPDLLRWANTPPEGANDSIDDVLKGGRVALLVPAHRYSEAGALVTALLKARLFAGLKRRADYGLGPDETPVLMIVDEAQEVLVPDDATMIAIGRSLKLAVVAATQTVEGVKEKLGEAVARKWLGIFGSVLVFPGRSPETDQFVAGRAGQIFQPQVTEAQGVMVRTSLLKHSVCGATAASRGQKSLEGVSAEEGVSLRRLFSHVGGLFREATVAPGAGDPVSKLGLRPLTDAAEIPSLLAEPDTALALVTRGRVVWRDVIKVEPKYA